MALSRLHISIFLGLAIGAWYVVLLLQGVPVSTRHFVPFGSVVGFLVGVTALFEKRLWYQRWLNSWFVKRPDLRGTWRVTFHSDWWDPQTGKQSPASTAYASVEQTLSDLQIHLMTAESDSRLIAHQISPSPSNNGYRIVGVYLNEPRVELRGSRSEIHRGALVIDTHGDPVTPNSLTGEYWTDRNTAGRIEFEDRISEVYTRYEDAQAAFVRNPPNNAIELKENA